MAGSKVSGPIQTTLYAETGISAMPASWAAVSGAQGILNGTDHKIERVVDIGDQGETSNVLNWIEFGEGSEKGIAGPAGRSTFSFSVVVDDSKAQQKALIAAANGTQILVAVLTISDGKLVQASGGTTEATVDLILGTIASKTKVRGTGGPNQVTFEIAVESNATYHQS